jgi:hypothetical protein
MLERVVELKKAVEVYCVQEDKPGFTAEEWKIFENLIEILQPYNAFTEKISGSSYVTISQLYSHVKVLLLTIATVTPIPSLKDFYDYLRLETAKRFADIPDAALLAIKLDPRHFHAKFLSLVQVKHCALKFSIRGQELINC